MGRREDGAIGVPIPGLVDVATDGRAHPESVRPAPRDRTVESLGRLAGHAESPGVQCRPDVLARPV
jgi:hypothetical protein